ncbi:Ser/Thr protein phosphatase family protein [Gloeomargarita lithophora Alchichica-D10]|uniref:Ser/Thr protein phosphatase family protein n=1 Tax=Gloeomargarita lithophora Alchichica-D10 TaxID=1188229 RepID=A0A1J0A9P2_9CYAN|nr:TIGR04168 family protein [Gloeomargarita lithophora]APB32643.1 Ser/Thr protein phosphatase family protein [Gloeomargarita lithophora Alchichica-D10]
MVRLAVVGDVHDQWQANDALALAHLGVDLVLFVGDFGNESLGVVQAVAGLAWPKAVVLGNHDAWYTATDWGRRKCPYDRQNEDRFQAQLEILGDLQVGYGGREFPDLAVTVVGGRPCSWGGGEWKLGEFYQRYFGVGGWADSQARITQAIRQAQSRRVILLNHNGPTGLGTEPQAPCGRDWAPVGGDYGDPDLRAAIQRAQTEGIAIPLVVFGHMHRHLRGNLGQRRMWQRDEGGTVYFNAAVVPRIHTVGGATLHHFGLVELGADGVASLAQVWVHPERGVVETEWLVQPIVLERHYLERH